MRSIRVFSIASALGFVVACSGAAGSNLLGPGGGGSSSSGGSGSGSGSGGSSGSTGSSGGSSNGGHDGGDHGDSGMAMDSSGGPIDSGTVDVVEAGNGDPGVYCGMNTYCDVSSQQCCVTGTGQAEIHMCQGANDTCAGTPITCDDTADCPMGMVCCGQLDQQQMSYLQVQCQSDCSQFDQRQFCDPKVNDCLQGTCNPSTILPGYHACR